MIDILIELLISLAAASKLLPGRPSITTLWRWHHRGVRGVKLETVVIGGRRYTSREAIARFIAATTAARDGQPTLLRSPIARERAIAQAEQELKKAGI